MINFSLKLCLKATITTFIFLGTIFFPPSVWANPQDVYYPGVCEMNNAKRATRNAAGETNLEMLNCSQDNQDAAEGEEKETLVTGPDVNNYQLSSTMFNMMNMIACTDTDPAVCKPTSTALGQISLAMQSLYLNPPASFAWYARDVMANAGLAKPVMAQGIGFAGLSPLLPLWKATRNVAYAVIILVMVVIGFMIIFRMKIDPKTVISIQAALPKIITTLVLITFSYAIVGLCVDVMYLSMFIMIDIFAKSFGWTPNVTAATQQAYATGGSGFLFGNIIDIGFVKTIDNFFTQYWGVGAGATGLTLLFGALFPSLLAFPLSLFLPLIGSIILLLLVFLALVFIWVRFLVVLFNSYISLLIALILGPLTLLQEAIPGKSAFGNWIKGIISNLIVFPATAMILLFAWYIADEKNTGIWKPPYLMFGTGGSAFNGLFALALIFMGPGLITKLKQSFKAPGPVPMSAGSIFAPFTGAVQTGAGAMSQFYYTKMTFDSIFKKGAKNHIPS